MLTKLTKEERRAIRAKGWVKNEAETAAAKIFQELSIAHVRRGYPDYTILRDDDIVGFIEVKPNADKSLRKDQIRFARFCHYHSIPFLKWTPADGEKAISEFMHTIYNPVTTWRYQPTT